MILNKIFAFLKEINGTYLFLIKFRLLFDKDLLKWVISAWGLDTSMYCGNWDYYYPQPINRPYYPRDRDDKWIWFKSELMPVEVLIPVEVWNEIIDEDEFGWFPVNYDNLTFFRGKLMPIEMYRKIIDNEKSKL